MKTKSRILIPMMILILLTLTACGKSDQGSPKLLDLGADKCIPCKQMAPILEELAVEYTGVLEVEFIDVWKPENQEAATTYGINKIPTQIFFDPKGNELWRHVGFISKEDILNKWRELGYDLKPLKKAVATDECSGDCSADPSSEACTCK